MDGYIKWLREHVGSRKILLVFASVGIVDDAGRLLWQQRGDFGWWGLPGGVLELDEDLASCARREACEETGLEVVIERLVGVYSSPDYDVVYPNGDEVQQVTFCFAARPVGGTLAVDQEETLALSWNGPDEIPITTPWYRHMAEDLYAGNLEASFRRGQPGRERAAEPYFRWLRRYIGQAPFVAPTAAVAIFDNQDRILLVKRSDNGQWSLPGGMMELGERLDQTAASEIKEETGLDVAPERLVGIYTNDTYQLRYPNGDELKVASSLFRCRITGGTLQPDMDEVSAARFFAPDELPPLSPRYHNRVADAIANRPGVVLS